MDLFLSLPFFAQAQNGREGNFMQTLIMIAIAIIFFYFILWRPERKRRKAMENLRSNMKKGDRVTAMGILGEVEQVKDNSVILKMVDGAKIEVVKQAITEIQNSGDKVETVEKK